MSSFFDDIKRLDDMLQEANGDSLKRWVVFGLGESGQEKIKFVAPAQIMVDGKTYPLPLQIFFEDKETLKRKILSIIDNFYDKMNSEDANLRV